MPSLGALVEPSPSVTGIHGITLQTRAVPGALQERVTDEHELNA